MDNLLSPEPIDSFGHGTIVTGIALGENRYSKKDWGVDIQVIPVKVSNDVDGKIDMFNATCGVYYAMKHGAKVINMSFGYKDERLDYISRPHLMEKAIQDARKQGVVIVTALGNDSTELAFNKTLFWPAAFSYDCDNVISVASADANSAASRRSSFSNWSSNKRLMDVLATGKSIESYTPTSVKMYDTTLHKYVPKTNPSRRAKASGTSMAAPFVTREVAIMLALRKPAKVGEVKKHIKKYVNPNKLIKTDDAINNW
jgi:serine protease